ncbi:oxygenase MpaB family protein [Rhodomicrobium lacus]|uniref:oxygenase MpaB family protein n=1 Tax=Rhodomicrobium lacus TaxID=2498452 RepID=UPI0026E249CF|nr:oxygenase MpaB family protein [Rhodomicrobium lacus]WKW51082.1 oxygenase MpaB family protein [Rhodomicrobium lacus]
MSGSNAVTAQTFFHGALARRLDRASRALLEPEDGRAMDSSRAAGEPALGQPTQVSWRIFKNPLTVFIGGVAAVILELAEPRVRTGVWEHTSFRTQPLRRLRRTGLAAMMTVYGPASAAQAMIAGVRRMHARVKGTTPGGEPYCADDPELLNWVQATAAYGFLQAYHTYSRPIPQADRDRYYREGETVARLYGATLPPRSEAELDAAFAAMLPRLEPSPIIFEFLDIMRTTRIVPPVSRALTPAAYLAQPLFVRAAVSLTPPRIRERLGLGPSYGLRPFERAILRQAAALADRIVLHSSPAVQSCQRLGLPADFLYASH